jgi:neurotransmitter:Na+ symporter, NSS family
LTALGCLFVVYFSKDLKALDTIDFWVGTFLIFVMATILIVVFGWGMGIEKGWQEAHKGAAVRIPNFFKLVIKYLCPLYLLAIFAFWILFNVFGWNPSTGEFKPTNYVTDLVGVHPDPVARLGVGVIAVTVVFFLITTAAAGRRWDRVSRQPGSDTGKEAGP